MLSEPYSIFLVNILIKQNFLDFLTMNNSARGLFYLQFSFLIFVFLPLEAMKSSSTTDSHAHLFTPTAQINALAKAEEMIAEFAKLKVEMTKKITPSLHKKAQTMCEEANLVSAYFVKCISNMVDGSAPLAESVMETMMANIGILEEQVIALEQIDGTLVKKEEKEIVCAMSTAESTRDHILASLAKVAEHKEKDDSSNKKFPGTQAIGAAADDIKAVINARVAGHHDGKESSEELHTSLQSLHAGIQDMTVALNDLIKDKQVNKKENFDEQKKQEEEKQKKEADLAFQELMRGKQSGSKSKSPKMSEQKKQKAEKEFEQRQHAKKEQQEKEEKQRAEKAARKAAMAERRVLELERITQERKKAAEYKKQRQQEIAAQEHEREKLAQSFCETHQKKAVLAQWKDAYVARKNLRAQLVQMEAQQPEVEQKEVEHAKSLSVGKIEENAHNEKVESPLLTVVESCASEQIEVERAEVERLEKERLMHEQEQQAKQAQALEQVAQQQTQLITMQTQLAALQAQLQQVQLQQAQFQHAQAVHIIPVQQHTVPAAQQAQQAPRALFSSVGLKQEEEALFKAVVQADFSTAEQVLKHNPSTANTCDVEGNTPLMVAVACNNLGMANVLVNAGADVKAQNSSSTDKPAEHVAREWGNIAMLETLRTRSENVITGPVLKYLRFHDERKVGVINQQQAVIKQQQEAGECQVGIINQQHAIIRQEQESNRLLRIFFERQRKYTQKQSDEIAWLRNQNRALRLIKR